VQTRPAVEPSQPPVRRITGLLLWTHLSSLSSAEIENKWRYGSSLYAFGVWTGKFYLLTKVIKLWQEVKMKQ
jgi:hypothetical protein